MSDWKETTLYEIIDLIGGGTPKTSISEYWNGDIPWLSVADFNNGKKYVYQTEKTITEAGLTNSSTKLLNKGDIIISARGTVGIVAVLGREMTFNQSCYGIRAKVELTTTDYIYYLLKDTVSDFLQIAHGGVFDTITKDTFREVDVKLPPLAEQNEIVSILSSLDDKIDLLHRQNTTLEKMAETLFRQWFVEDAKEEWEEKTLGEITEIKAGGDKPRIYSDTKTEECKVPIFSNGIDREGLYGFTNTAKIFKECITISARGTIGFVCLRQEPFVPIVRLISIVPNEQYLSSKYLYLWAKTQDILGTGTTQEQLTVPDFSRTKIVLPPFTKMIEFTNHVNSFFRKKHFNQSQIRILIALRDTLLPKLMSGEVRLKI